jgi:DNA-binding MarR family transcriptional regulator
MPEHDLATRPGWLLWQLSHVLEQLLIAELGKQGLTLVSFGALHTLSARPGLSTADLAREALVTPQNMSVTITRLVEDGRVKRRPHEVHGRVQRLELTAKGRTALKRAWLIVLACEERMTAELSASENAAFVRIMQRSLGTLQEHAKKPRARARSV